VKAIQPAAQHENLLPQECGSAASGGAAGFPAASVGTVLFLPGIRLAVGIEGWISAIFHRKQRALPKRAEHMLQ